MKGIHIKRSFKQIACINFVIIFITTFPFLVSDALFAENIEFSPYDLVKRMLSTCYLEDAHTTRSLFSWLQIDQGIKVLTIVYAFTLFMTILTVQPRRINMAFLLFSYGNLALFLYQFIWHIEGIIIFAEMLEQSSLSPLECSSEYEPYMIVSSSLGTLLILANIVLSFLRPKEIENFDQEENNLKGIKINKSPA